MFQDALKSIDLKFDLLISSIFEDYYRSQSGKGDKDIFKFLPVTNSWPCNFSQIIIIHEYRAEKQIKNKFKIQKLDGKNSTSMNVLNNLDIYIFFV